MNPRAQTNEAELLLYGDIGNYEGWNDVTAKEFVRELAALGDVDTINLHINSVGGDVFAGQAIHSMLKRHKAVVNVYVDGLAASIASVVAMAGDNIYMPKNAMMMIHQPWSGYIGNAKEFRKAADDLDKIADSIVMAYQEKTGLEKAQIVQIMDDETWLTAAEAVELGFATAETEKMPVSASLNGKMLAMNGLTFDLSRFNNFPQNLCKEVKSSVKIGEITAEVLQTEYSGVYESVKNTGYAQGIAAERARMQALDALSAPGCEEIINKARYETGQTATEIAVEVVAMLKTKLPGASVLNNLMQDGQEIKEINAGAEPQNGKMTEEERKTAAQKMAAAGNKLRGSAK